MVLVLLACAFVDGSDRARALDHDHDGLIAANLGGNDCDDEDAAVGAATRWYADADGDGVGAGPAVSACTAPEGDVATTDDCDDTDPNVTSGVVSTWYLDDDDDGFGSATTPTDACVAPVGHVADSTDCDDTNVDIHPAATETCDGVDDDCDGVESQCALGADGALLHDGAAHTGSFALALAPLDVGFRKHSIVIGKPTGGTGSVWWAALGNPNGEGEYEPDAAGSVVFGGEISGDGFGTAVATSDFWDADGTDDILVSAPGVSVDGVLNSGAVYVYDGQSISIPVATITWGSDGGHFGAMMSSPVFDDATWLFAAKPDADGGRGAVRMGYGFRGDVDLAAPPDEIGGATFFPETADEAEHGALGTALVQGDFNGDGNFDAAMSAPGYRNGAGRVYIMYGPLASTSALDISSPLVLDGDTADGAGTTLLSADLTGDGHDDLVIGAPDSIGQGERGGATFIINGDDLTSGSIATLGTSITGPVGSRFGAAMAAGAFDDGQKPGLVIGAPGWVNAHGDADAGAVIALPPALAAGAAFVLPEGAQNVYTCPTPSCFAGSALTTGDFDGDEILDVAFGAPGMVSSGQNDGAVGFLFGVSDFGLAN